MNNNPEKLKGQIRKFSKEHNVHAQEVLQMVMFEALLIRISTSKYKENFIIKGGVLVASLIGIQSRTTMDLDTSIIGINMTRKNLEKVIKEIIEVNDNDGVILDFYSIINIKENDQYQNFRVSIKARFGKMNIPLKIDITTGDVITPYPIKYYYPKILVDEKIEIKAYPLETILAEKYETIIRRGITNTRTRDFYDLYILVKLNESHIDFELLKTSIENTCKRRESLEIINNWYEIIEDIKKEERLYLIWKNYTLENNYSKQITFKDIVVFLEEFSANILF